MTEEMSEYMASKMALVHMSTAKDSLARAREYLGHRDASDVVARMETDIDRLCETLRETPPSQGRSTDGHS